MRSAKRIGLVLSGVLIGWFASGSLRAQPQQPAGGQRLIAIPAGNFASGQPAYFVQDTKTGACWLGIRSRDDVNAPLAPAPRESCER
jgi:hypothetical protein